MSLPEDFLTQLEQYSELSKREKEVFLEIFGRGKSRIQVAQALNISDSNLSSSLTGIYKKFRISGSGPVKENRLREYLGNRYAQQPSGVFTTHILDSNINALVQEIREQIKSSIRERCGTMRVLDMNQPIELTGERGIYTNVNILEKITGRRRLDITELLQNCDGENFERFGLSGVKEKRVSGLEAVRQHTKLMVLGKPGAGKTTFMKYLAMQCIEGHFQADRVPLFISLKDFAEAPKQPDLLKYISQQLSIYGVTDADVKADQLVRQSKALVLLDGLDEVREEDTKRVLRQIREISEQFHTNQFVITCRIAAKEYTFETFTEVEVADFDKEQIAMFARNWFRLSDPVKGKRFIEKLKGDEQIHELATNPLLLTLLCLVFGEAGNFPTNRSELYKEGLDVLLKKWDAKRNIERDVVYKNLSLQRREDLLSQIALTTFEQKDYFFKQKTIEAYIVGFIRNLRDADTDPEVLKLDSEAVLKSIEAQHGLLVERAKGIYSFSHLTFHEYFTARGIIAYSTWENLVKHIAEKRWREVVLLTAGMMPKADELVRLMKKKIDGLLTNDDKLQQVLTWIYEKSCMALLPYPKQYVKAIYLWLAKRSVAFDNNLINNCDRLLWLLLFDLALTEISDFGIYKYFSKISVEGIGIPVFDMTLYISLDRKNCGFLRETKSNFQFNFQLEFKLKPPKSEMRILLANIKKLLPKPNLDKKANVEWWEANGQIVIEQLRTMMIEHRNIGHDWQLSDVQKQLLQQYYDANGLLVNCLNSDCYISYEVRQEIEETLLLPVAEIEKRQRIL
ncbi:hypothetical protein NUACC21_26240 [Scytonema sp. NUACC21]